MEHLTEMIKESGKVPLAVIFIIALAELAALLRVYIPVVTKKISDANTPGGCGSNKQAQKPCNNDVRAEHEKRFNAVEGLLQADMQERKKMLAEFDKKLHKMSRVINGNTLQSCVAVMYNPDAPPLEQFNAAITYFKLHGNGNGQERVSRIILRTEKGYELWKSALNEDMKKNGPYDDRYFQEALSWIEARHA